MTWLGGQLIAFERGYIISWSLTGDQVDSSGLVFLRVRYYDPRTGRFITKDPFPGLPSQPQTQHPYVYVADNPVTHTDPSGLFAPWDLVDIGFFAWDLIGFIKCPTWGKAGWLALDIVGLLPLIPNLGMVGRFLGRGDDTIKLFRAISHDELIEVAPQKTVVKG